MTHSMHFGANKQSGKNDSHMLTLNCELQADSSTESQGNSLWHFQQKFPLDISNITFLKWFPLLIFPPLFSSHFSFYLWNSFRGHHCLTSFVFLFCQKPLRICNKGLIFHEDILIQVLKKTCITNTQIWNLGRWQWWPCMRDSKGDTDV